MVKRPTKGKNILDKVFTNATGMYSELIVLPPLGSLPTGHGVVICQPQYVPAHSKQRYTTQVRRSDSNSKALFVHALQQTKWEDLYHKGTCLEQFEFFQTTIDCLLNTHMPTEVVTRNKNDKPWIT